MRSLLLLFIIICSTTFYAQKKKKDTLPIPKFKIHGRFAFVLNQSSFSNWVAGGQNTIAGNININYDFNYKKKNINWDSRLLTGYGLSHISDKGLRKTNDRLEINSLFGYKTKKYWFFSYFVNFRTQYTKGYNYKKDPYEVVSDFLSPAYLSFGPGMLWKKSDNFSFNIAPATARYTFVNNDFSGSFGVEEGRNTAFSLGLNFAGYYQFELMENIEVENILTLYSDYLGKASNVDLEHQTNINFIVNKYVKMNFTVHVIADDNASAKLQYRQLFGLGVNYSFHQKVTYQ